VSLTSTVSFYSSFYRLINTLNFGYHTNDGPFFKPG
jgi:hypothetical protein